jgi:twitching motility protein PilT
MESFTLQDLLRDLVKQGGSDLHLKVGSPPTFRVNGELRAHDSPRLMPDDIQRLIKPSMSEKQIAELASDRDLDYAISLSGVARFRASVFFQRGTVVGVFRAVPFDIPQLAGLSLPDACTELAARKSGLVLVTGATGSGKSTTLAAMVDHINRSRRVHILTLEDPIEFVHRDRTAIVNQRQVGADVHTFSVGVIRALRHDPDVILIGEMRDLETIESALTAAETGHLVLATLHTSSAAQTVDRILDVFPADKQAQVRLQLSATLQGILSQHLLPRLSGGRQAAVEVLVATRGIRAMIRDGKTHQITSAIQSGGRHGMQTMAMAVEAAVESGNVDPAVAEQYLPDPAGV